MKSLPGLFRNIGIIQTSWFQTRLASRFSPVSCPFSALPCAADCWSDVVDLFLSHAQFDLFCNIWWNKSKWQHHFNSAMWKLRPAVELMVQSVRHRCYLLLLIKVFNYLRVFPVRFRSVPQVSLAGILTTLSIKPNGSCLHGYLQELSGVKLSAHLVNAENEVEPSSSLSVSNDRTKSAHTAHLTASVWWLSGGQNLWWWTGEVHPHWCPHCQWAGETGRLVLWCGCSGVAMHVKVPCHWCMFVSVRLSACRAPLGLPHAICSL